MHREDGGAANSHCTPADCWCIVLVVLVLVGFCLAMLGPPRFLYGSQRKVVMISLYEGDKTLNAALWVEVDTEHCYEDVLKSVARQLITSHNAKAAANSSLKWSPGQLWITKTDKGPVFLAEVCHYIERRYQNSDSVITLIPETVQVLESKQ